MNPFHAFAEELLKLAARPPLPPRSSKRLAPVAASFEVQPVMQGQEGIQALNTAGTGTDSTSRG